MLKNNYIIINHNLVLQILRSNKRHKSFQQNPQQKLNKVQKRIQLHKQLQLTRD